MIPPSPNSLIAKKPALSFVLCNGSVAVAALVMYLSGTPSSLVLFSVTIALVVTNGVLLILRRKVVAAPLVETIAEAGFVPQSKKRAWLCLGSGTVLLLSSVFLIVHPRLQSDRPFGFIMLIGSPAILIMAWKEFRKSDPN
jgi:hypothetical protein